MKRAGFTLIELLVVITIIAILAGLAMSALPGVLESARAKGTEGNNLHQLGMAMQQYLADNDQSLFEVTTSSTVSPWPRLLNPLSTTGGSRYVGTWKVFHSPFDRRPDTDADSASAPAAVSYGINANILNPQYSAPSSTLGTVSKNNTSTWNFPSQLILLAPKPDLNPSGLTFTGSSNTAPAGPLIDSSQITPVSNPSDANQMGTWSKRKKISVLYADIHVDPGLLYYTYSDSQSPATATGTGTKSGGQRRWYPDAQ
jgi:prepilin-type N-terminal cleavage/methylation domain-containing protein